MKILHLPPMLQHGVARGTARRAVRFGRPYRGRLGLLLAVVILDALLAASVPLLFGLIVNAIIAKNHGQIIGLAIALAAVAVLDQLLGVTSVFLSARIGQGITFDLRSAVYEHIQKLPLAFFTRTPTGALMSRLDNDVAGAQQAFTDLSSVVVSNALILIVSFGVMFALSWQFALLTLVSLPVGGLIVRFARTRVAGLSWANLQALSNMSTHMSERFNVGGSLLVTLFGRRHVEAQKFNRLSGEVRDIQVKVAVYGRSFSAILLVVSGLVTALIFGWGGILAANGTIKAGTVVALVTYLGRIYGPLISLGGLPIDVVNALVSFERLFEVLDVPVGLGERPGAIDIPPGPATVLVDDVNFAYPGREGNSIPSLEDGSPPETLTETAVLSDVSFDIAPGQLVALLGHTGAGKTTISYLIRRLYDVSSGSVSVNGVDVRDATARSLQERIGMVTQDVHLFHDTIRANLLYRAARRVRRGPATRARRGPVAHDGGPAARRPRDRRRRPGLPPLGGREATPGPGPHDAGHAVGRRVGRGHGVAGHGHRAGGPTRPRGRPGRAHVVGHRAPAFDHPAGRPDPRPRPRAHRRARHPRRASGSAGPLLRALHGAVRRLGVAGTDQRRTGLSAETATGPREAGRLSEIFSGARRSLDRRRCALEADLDADVQQRADAEENVAVKNAGTAHSEFRKRPELGKRRGLVLFRHVIRHW